MIVEVHGTGFWTRVRFPPGPLFNESAEYAKMRRIPLKKGPPHFSFFMFILIFRKNIVILDFYATRNASKCNTKSDDTI